MAGIIPSFAPLVAHFTQQIASLGGKYLDNHWKRHCQRAAVESFSKVSQPEFVAPTMAAVHSVEVKQVFDAVVVENVQCPIPFLLTFSATSLPTHCEG
jgi:hypothetical protein